MLQINISGNITADAITKTINGKSCVSFTVANNITTVKEDGTLSQQTNFLSCSLWNKPNTADLFYKGRPVNIAGLLNIKTSNDRIYLNVSVSSFQVFGKAKPKNKPAAATSESNTSQSESPEDTTSQQFDEGFTNDEPQAIDLPF